jgi:hypothetical protein
MARPPTEAKGIDYAGKSDFAERDPIIYSNGDQVDRVNDLLDQLTAKRFACAAVCAQILRTSLELAGIQLPLLEVEIPYEGSGGGSVADGKFILHGVETGSDPAMYAPPTEGEWLFKIVDSDGPDDDYDDYLHLYIVMDLDEQNLIECYAQILSDDEVGDVMNMDNVSAKDYEELVGDVAGETDWLKQQRHIGTFKGTD